MNSSRCPGQQTIRFAVLLVAIGYAVPTVAWGDEAKNPSEKWEGDIRAFEAADRENPPPTKAVFFVGSSSIRLWDLRRYFPDLPTINRGFGGSEVADALAFAERIIIPYHPRAIVVYAGDNDIAGGKSAERVADDFKKLVAKIRSDLPDTPILYLSIKPSIARWRLYDKMSDANRRIASIASSADGVYFVDVATPMLHGSGPPDATLFVEDGLHLSEKGYKLWTGILEAKLAELHLLSLTDK
jgi:lysophospholipase L1-like esterase